MSSADRVAVPTNGHRPAMKDDPLDPPHHDASPSEDRSAPRPAPAATPSFTPGQVIAGFGIVAALALLLFGRRRGRG